MGEEEEGWKIYFWTLAASTVESGSGSASHSLFFWLELQRGPIQSRERKRPERT
jgi:hypothetical protein